MTANLVKNGNDKTNILGTERSYSLNGNRKGFKLESGANAWAEDILTVYMNNEASDGVASSVDLEWVITIQPF